MNLFAKPIRISLAAARVNARMNQREMAEFIGVDLSTITNWEKGKSEPSTSQLRKSVRYQVYQWIIFLYLNNPRK